MAFLLFTARLAIEAASQPGTLSVIVPVGNGVRTGERVLAIRGITLSWLSILAPGSLSLFLVVDMLHIESGELDVASEIWPGSLRAERYVCIS